MYDTVSSDEEDEEEVSDDEPEVDEYDYPLESSEAAHVERFSRDKTGNCIFCPVCLRGTGKRCQVPKLHGLYKHCRDRQEDGYRAEAHASMMAIIERFEKGASASREHPHAKRRRHNGAHRPPPASDARSPPVLPPVVVVQNIRRRRDNIGHWTASTSAVLAPFQAAVGAAGATVRALTLKTWYTNEGVRGRGACAPGYVLLDRTPEGITAALAIDSAFGSEDQGRAAWARDAAACHARAEADEQGRVYAYLATEADMRSLDPRARDTRWCKATWEDFVFHESTCTREALNVPVDDPHHPDASANAELRDAMEKAPAKDLLHAIHDIGSTV